MILIDVEHLNQSPAPFIIGHKISPTFGDSIICSKRFGRTYSFKGKYLECVTDNAFTCIFMTKLNTSLFICANLSLLGPIKHLVIALQDNVDACEFFFVNTASFIINLYSTLLFKSYSVYIKLLFQLKFLLKNEFQSNISEEILATLSSQI